MIVVSNTTPLRYLVEIDSVHILPAMFGKILTSPAVLDELCFPHFPQRVRQWAQSPPNWLQVVLPVQSIEGENDIHPGEAQVIALALERGADRLLIDDDDAKRFARSKGIRVVGTLAVLGIADELKLLSVPLVDAFERLKRTQFRVSDELLTRFIKGDPAVRQIVQSEATRVATEVERRDVR